MSEPPKESVTYVGIHKPAPRYIGSWGPFALAFCYHFREGFERYELRLIWRWGRPLKNWPHRRQIVLGLSEWTAV